MVSPLMKMLIGAQLYYWARLAQNNIIGMAPNKIIGMANNKKNGMAPNSIIGHQPNLNFIGLANSNCIARHLNNIGRHSQSQFY